MKIKFLPFLILALLPLNLIASEDKMKFGRFGDVTIYGGGNRSAKHFIIFLSGDGGWNKGVVDMAISLAGLDSVVAGVSVPAYLKNLKSLKGRCYYPASDFESLSHYLQKKLEFNNYLKPSLVGYSSGATIVYGILSQAPPGTFQGAISLGFCSDLEIDKPFCKGHGLEQTPIKNGFDFKPDPNLENPWFVLNGNKDKVCPIEGQRQFIAQTKNATLIELPKVGHGFGVQKNWMPQFKDAFLKYSEFAPEPEKIVGDLKDLPLIELKAESKKDTLVVILSGDGGWASIDKEMAKELNSQGFSVVGFDCLKYFWNSKSPNSLGKDMERIGTFYLKEWNQKNIIWIGYSMGADVLPFGLSRLGPYLKQKTLGVALLGLSNFAEFEFHLTNWLSSKSSGGLEIKPELEKLKDLKFICIQGQNDEEKGCDLVTNDNFLKLVFPGGHHFSGDYPLLAKKILERFAL